MPLDPQETLSRLISGRTDELVELTRDLIRLMKEEEK